MDWRFIGELFKGIFTFSDNIIQSILAYAGILSFIYLLFPQLEGKMKGRLSSARKYGIHIAWAFILISVIMAANSLYGKVNQQVITLTNELHKYETLPTIDQMVILDYLKDIPIPLADYAKDITIIRDRTFDGCDIHGPAVISLNYGTNQVFICTVDVPFDTAFITTTNIRVTGVVAFDNCTFKNCKFKNVSFLGNENAIAKARSEFTFDSANK